MKRWVPPVVVVIIVVTSAMAVRSLVAKRKREIAYRVALQKYSYDLKPGLRRTEVESYLHARDTNFSWAFTAFGSRRETQYADLIKIGEEAAPWFCSEAHVYAALEFSSVREFQQNDSDLLERVEIFRPYTGCL